MHKNMSLDGLNKVLKNVASDFTHNSTLKMTPIPCWVTSDVLMNPNEGRSHRLTELRQP